MTYAAETASVVGGSSPTQWSQAYIGSILVAVVTTQGEKAPQQGVDFLNRLQSQSSARVPQTLAELQQLAKECTIGLDVSYAVSLTVDAVLYLVVHGAGQVWVRRGDKHAVILSGEGTASGELKSGDSVLLASEGFVEHVSEKELQKALSLSTPSSIAEALALKLHKQTTLPIISAAIFSVLPAKNDRPLPEFVYRIKRLVGRLKLVRLFPSKLVSLIKKRPLVGLMVGLVIVLLVSIGIGLIRQNKDTQQQAGEQVLSDIDHRYSEAMSLVDLNPVRARELLTEANDLLTEELTKQHSKELQKQLQDYVEKIHSGMAFATRSYEVTPEPFFLLDLVKPGGAGKAMSLYQDVLAILDTKNGAIYTVTIDTKSSRIVAGGAAVARATEVFVHGEDVYAFTDTLTKVSLSQGGLVNVIPADSEWGGITTFSVYAGSLYLVDPSKNAIWKYIATETGFSNKQNYLLYDTLINLSGVSDMVIDGGIWLVDGGNITYLLQGKDTGWTAKGLDQDLGTQLKLYTNEDSKNLYVLDQDHKRVVVFDKDGTYLSQYRWETDLSVVDFAVSEELKKILLLTRDTIYAIELK